MNPRLFTINRKTLSDFSHELFVIPAYQRPFNWGYDEITKLLYDLKENQKENLYFIGNIIVISNNGKFDLVDGQQRFTTLWMITLYLSKMYNNHDFIQFCTLNNRSRLSFAIRDKTDKYLNTLLIADTKGSKNFWELTDFLPDDNTRDPSLTQNQIIANNFKIIDQWVHENKIEKSFLEFIKTNLTFEFLIAPSGTDENKLFIQINTNGAQLQHYDILKSKIINAVREEERPEYSVKWDRCSEIFDHKGDDNFFPTFEEKLVDILDSDEKKRYFKQHNSIKNEPRDAYQQIISFSTLLIHNLFIYTKIEKDNLKLDFPKFFNIEKLLDIFGELSRCMDKADLEQRNQYAKNFIDCLVNVKEKLSTSIIFSDLEDNDFGLLINLKNKQEEREENNKSVEQLQRMLYHSNNDTNHYWLGIYLDQLLDSPQSGFLDILEKIDNIISINGNTFSTYKSYFENPADFLCQKNEFNLTNYTFTFKNFNRYWFYKLEYLLWKNDTGNLSKIISRTSVEHVLPQSEKKHYKEKTIDIDELGNLILITVSENSRFSNKDVLEKNEYRKRLSNPPLKMTKLFNDLDQYKLIKDKYSDDELIKLKEVLKNHQCEMQNLLIKHYK
ncbi:DUF262 domain-containing HNH endonuclease family protein [Chryseobacterium sp.]|uniref:DUF262 domain-containing protein n=1 Tax=Chryseobacterium sp. TaxID=1871047 RepID=UPI001B27A9A1|nr:DUF262 domain-containing HNH endonuclease family protein [Chryseobacterium sp.]MBO9690302.1 DUF262 domain-containing protein [Chryseobacterium sp.]